MKEFRTVADRARSTRTKADTIQLLERYATTGCSTYRVDSDLFREVWPNEDPEGYTLHPYNAGDAVDCHTVTFKKSVYVGQYLADLNQIMTWIIRNGHNGHKIVTIYSTGVNNYGKPRIHVCHKSAKRLGLEGEGVLVPDTDGHYQAIMEGVEVVWIQDTKGSE